MGVSNKSVGNLFRNTPSECLLLEPVTPGMVRVLAI